MGLPVHGQGHDEEEDRHVQVMRFTEPLILTWLSDRLYYQHCIFTGSQRWPGKFCLCCFKGRHSRSVTTQRISLPTRFNISRFYKSSSRRSRAIRRPRERRCAGVHRDRDDIRYEHLFFINS